MLFVFLKSHIKGYVRKDGTFVRDHTTRVQAKPAPYKPAVTVHWPYKSAEDMQGGLFGPSSHHAAASWQHAVLHPQLGEDGQPFQINQPSVATAPDTWTDKERIALFVPGGDAPAALNGIAFAPWTGAPKTEAGWDAVDGQLDSLAEPPMQSKGKAPAAGVVIEEPDGRIWIVRPSNGFAGYEATFPKGHADEGMSLQATAIKEAWEESGLQVAITGYIGDVERSTTMTRYYAARRVGGTPAAMGWETQGVALVPKAELHAYLNRDVDRHVAKLAGIAAPVGAVESADAWQKVGKQAGSNPGGVFRDSLGQDWYVKLPKSADIAKNEVLAGKLYAAAGIRVPELKQVTVGGKLGVASRIIPGLRQARDALIMGEVDGIHDGFIVDAWLANWDVVGLLYDNLVVDAEGQPVRVDVGGALLYRAQGEPKGKAFGGKVGELTSLIDGKNPNCATVFGGITTPEIEAGIARVAAMPDETIHTLCDTFGPGNQEQRVALAATLIARKAYLAALL